MPVGVRNDDIGAQLAAVFETHGDGPIAFDKDRGHARLITDGALELEEATLHRTRKRHRAADWPAIVADAHAADEGHEHHQGDLRPIADERRKRPPLERIAETLGEIGERHRAVACEQRRLGKGLQALHRAGDSKPQQIEMGKLPNRPHQFGYHYRIGRSEIAQMAFQLVEVRVDDEWRAVPAFDTHQFVRGPHFAG